MAVRQITAIDGNIAAVRKQHPGGLHFVVGDTHGEVWTLRALMEKIAFNPELDHVFFVGDYNGGGSVRDLLGYIALYYQEDCSLPGFHMIRGNHEWELMPVYPLANLPDIIVYCGDNLNYFIVHAGMVSSAFDLILKDMAEDPAGRLFSYRLDRPCVDKDAPLRQLIWSRRGLYSQKSRWQVWPRTDDLVNNYAYIIHGHTPYCFFKNQYYGYGDNSLFWEPQKIWFSEDLCSFNIDSNIKGRYENGESSRGLTCLCLEVLEEIAAANDCYLSVDSLAEGPNGVFSVPYRSGWPTEAYGDINRILNAAPKMKTITLDENRKPVIV